MNILILGATGFIGSAVAQRLLADAHSITGLARNPETARNREPHIHWIEGDLRNFTSPSSWLALSIGLYIVTGLFWLPVVWIQMRLRDLARVAAQTGAALPAEFDRLYWIWFAFGFPAFFAVLAIIWLMITRPAISFW